MRERMTAACWALGTILLASAAGAQEPKSAQAPGTAEGKKQSEGVGSVPVAPADGEVAGTGANPSEEVAAGAVAEGEAQENKAAAGVVCGLDNFSGMDESDARAAAGLICQELRRYGQLEEDFDGTLGPAPEGYRIRVYRVGQRMLLELSYEKPLGAIQSTARVELDSIDEVVEQSSALVLALKEGKPIPKKAPKVEPVQGADQEQSVRQEPSILMYAGIVGYITVGDVSASAGGADLGITAPVGQFSLTPYGRLAFGELSLGALGIDLRYYTSRSDAAFFVGAGMSAMGFGIENDGGGGPAGSALLGVEFNREARSRVGLNVRADFPAFSLDSSGYAVPLGINLYLTL